MNRNDSSFKFHYFWLVIAACAAASLAIGTRNGEQEKSKVQISILCPGPVDTNFNKVADVEFALKGLSSEYVARYATEKMLKGKFYIVPGWKIRLAKFASKITPSSVVARVSYNMQKRKIK